jgi:hypothetical protein
MAAFCIRLLAYRLLKPRPLSNGVLFERQNKTIIIITIIISWPTHIRAMQPSSPARHFEHGMAGPALRRSKQAWLLAGILQRRNLCTRSVRAGEPEYM